MSRMSFGTASPSCPVRRRAEEDRLLRIKTDLHTKLISEMDLSAIGSMNEEELRDEVRRGAEQLCRQSNDLLSLSERERLIGEVLDETFGIGPLESPDARPDDLGHPGQRAEVCLHRASRPAEPSPTWSSTTRSTSSRSSGGSSAGSVGGSTRPRRCATPGCPTARESTRSSRRWPWTGRLLSIRRASKTPLQFKDLVDKKAITPEMVDFLGRDPRSGQHGGLRRHRLGQDDADERPLLVHPRATSGSRRSRTPRSFGSSSRTSSGWRPGRRTSRATARS